MKPRVFVSSVVEGFGGFREAARAGIIAAGGEPVLVNEDFPSLASSSRNACLDAVDSSDFVLSIIGERGGWTTPSGKLVVEEEYERALIQRRPVLIFLQNTSRDADATRLVRQLSDYIDGTFRRTFTTEDELRQEVERALRPLLASPATRTSMATPWRDYFLHPYTPQSMTMLRFVLTSERHEEVVDPVRLSSDAFKRQIYGLAHAENVELMSYEQPKSASLEGNDLVIVQTDASARHGEGEHVRLQIAESGELVIDANVTGRVARGERFMGLSSMVVALEDIAMILRLCFAFAAAFYDEIDRYKRHQRFLYDVGLSGLEYRTLERNPQTRTSYTMSMREAGVIRAFPEPRVVTRNHLRTPAEEIERVVVMLERRARS